MRPAPATAWGFVRRPARGSSVRRLRWHAIALLCLTTSVERYQVFQPRGVAGTLAVQRGGTRPWDRGSRNRLADWPARSRRAVEAATTPTGAPRPGRCHHRAQGQGLTRKRALVRVTGGENANWLHVQASRAKRETRIYAVVGPGSAAWSWTCRRSSRAAPTNSSSAGCARRLQAARPR